MPLRRPPKEEGEEDEEPQSFWKGLARDLLVAAIIVALFLASIFAYTRVWPPLVVVESDSMQHADGESSFGVIDTGDMVFQQAAPNRADVITYIEGRASGYATYSDFGDVIIFNRLGNPTPVIHRAIMYVTIYPNGTADVPDLALMSTDWEATNIAGTTRNPYFLRTVTIHHMGFRQNLGITFDFFALRNFGPRSGYITMGDHNAYEACQANPDPCRPYTPYDTGWIPRQADINGHARGEIPWFGLLKLTLQPTDSCCSLGWGDYRAPKNSWDSLAVSLVVLFALPFILDYGVRGWTKYISPRLPEIPWPWRRKRTADGGDRNPEEHGDDSREESRNRSKKRPPKEESSEP